MDREERKRLKKLLRFEEAAQEKGFKAIAGVDEAGRGPLAGPVVAAACILPQEFMLEGVDDSKKLSPEERNRLYQLLTEHPGIYYGVGIVETLIIDQINILQATLRAMAAAVAALSKKPDLLLVDGKQTPNCGIAAQAIVDGDALSLSIAAASIIAKKRRDDLMLEYHEKWPEYGFHQHKGYGTKQHLAALEKHGPCPIHRMTFAPLKK